MPWALILQRCQNYDGRFEELASQIETLQKSQTALQQDIKAIKTNLTQVTSDFETLRKDFGDSNDSTNKALAQLVQRLKDFETTLESVALDAVRIQNLIADLENVKKDIENLKAEWENLSSTRMPHEFQHTVLPDAIEDLYETRGDLTSDTVWVFLQGGPSIESRYDLNKQKRINSITSDGQETVEEGDVFPFFTDDLIVYPYQSQHLNPVIYSNFDLTFEQAKRESSLSAEITFRVMEHFKNLEKTVYLIGHSYGAFLVHEVLAQYGPVARKSVSLNGRLDMNPAVVDAYSQGRPLIFDENGMNPYRDGNAEELETVDINMGKLAAGLIYNRYTEKLIETDLSSTIFVTATKDVQAGVFNQKEIDFLESKELGRELIVLEGTHGSIFGANLMKSLHDLIIESSTSLGDFTDTPSDEVSSLTSTHTAEPLFQEFVPTIIPSVIEDLYEMSGDATSDTVWVFVQGGPETEVIPLFTDGKTKGNDQYPFITDDLVVYPYQSQQIESSRFGGSDITFEQAKTESITTVEMVKLVVEHFIQEEKIVYLIGHSYGSLIIQEILSRYGPIANKSVSLNGRLDFEDEFWNALSEGSIYRYDENGQNPSLYARASENPTLLRNMAKLAAGLAHNRYTQKLADVDLSTTIFLTATKDKRAGVYNQKEMDFLDTKDLNHEVIILEGEHSDSLKPTEIKKWYDLLIM